MDENDVLKYLTLVGRKADIIMSVASWMPQYGEELEEIEGELGELRKIIDAEHRKRDRREQDAEARGH